MNRVEIKPLSVNQAWKGKRYRTEKYKNYATELLYKLPSIKIPEGHLELHIAIGFSSRGSDIDNPLKPLLDVLQRKYGINDNKIYRIVVDKVIVPKGEEFIDFQFGAFKNPYIPQSFNNSK